MPAMSQLLHKVSEYYSGKLALFGTTPAGVDWNGKESQETRFSQLLKIVNPDISYRLGDFGCGYGALLDKVRHDKNLYSYQGYDISPTMVEAARQRAFGFHKAIFTSRMEDLEGVDYLVASGVFNVRLENSETDWMEYFRQTLHSMDRIAKRGFAFNALTSYSDAEKMRGYLHYADPLSWFDYCKKNFSGHVALLHDYGLYEFTILVRREPLIKGGP